MNFVELLINKMKCKNREIVTFAIQFLDFFDRTIDDDDCRVRFFDDDVVVVDDVVEVLLSCSATIDARINDNNARSPARNITT